MTVRALHRVVGLIMLLPLLGWAVTGAIFFIKPGYEGAYESLPVKTYALDAPIAIGPNPEWLEIRVLRTILGDHLLARTAKGWQQYDLRTRQARSGPTSDELRALVADATSINRARYGEISTIDGRVATTTTGARVTLDWNRLALGQRGLDTDRIDAYYKIHYLQWTGVPWLDKIVGGIGLALVVILSLLGMRLLLSRRLPGTGR